MALTTSHTSAEARTAQLAEIAKALGSLTRDQLAKRFDPARMASSDIYPFMGEPPGPEEFDYLLGHFERLRSFLARGAKAGNGLIVYMN